MAKWIKFDEYGFSTTGKTKIWHVKSLENVLIGVIKWYGPWRKYSFFPEANTVIESTCHRDLADFEDKMTKAEICAEIKKCEVER